jgi:hypothetical protein
MLQASGGALELSKCSCHIIQWQFAMQGAPSLVPKVANSTVHQVKVVWDDHNKRSQHRQILGAYQAHKTIRHYKDPTGTQGEQFRPLRRKSNDITSFWWTCQLTRLEAWTYYYACYLPAVGYP